MPRRIRFPDIPRRGSDPDTYPDPVLAELHSTAMSMVRWALLLGLLLGLATGYAARPALDQWVVTQRERR